MAAGGGNVDAQKCLVTLYEKGKGTQQNINGAIYCYKKAIENGCQEVKESLDNLLNEM